MKTTVNIIIAITLIGAIAVFVRTAQISNERKKIEIEQEQQRIEQLNSLINQIEDAESNADYYAVIKLSNKLLETEQTNDFAFSKIQNAEKQIQELELQPVAQKSIGMYTNAASLKGVIPYYNSVIRNIEDQLEAAQDYHFSKDYDLAMREYRDVIEKCDQLQSLEVKRQAVLKHRRAALRLNIDIEASYKDKTQENRSYQEGLDYIKRAELAFQLAKFDSAEADYIAGISKMSEAQSFFVKQEAFELIQNQFNKSIKDSFQVADVKNKDELFNFIKANAPTQWQELSDDIKSMEKAEEQNDFETAISSCKKSLSTFQTAINDAVKHKQELVKQEKKKQKELLKNCPSLPKLKKMELNSELAVIPGKPFEVMLSTNVMMCMNPIRAGKSTLQLYRNDDSEPSDYTIVLKDNFWCAKSETTLEMFLQFINANNIFPDGVEISIYGPFVKNKKGKLELSKNKYSKFNDQPMFCLDWNMAIQFCEWLNKISEDKRPDNYIFRLPTEAEWTYCAMYEGDLMNTEEALVQIAWYSKNSSASSHKVCQLKPNEFGLYDMYGNVWEWCLDSYDPKYISSAPAVTTNRVCTISTNKKVVKGGSWDFTNKALKPLERQGFYKEAKQNAIGFRVVLAPQI
ncbi:MAG: SUMF1/EgtB/PvdO family nonheme iron enzyme [Kiritimatiellae bacterium]|jgi:formylglycine-generating enzyme required for sulfatase activity|nr:SUMF1/EgtB/PvdO family nonheme iron enzyme [Kiritimatiellia bacterium]